MLIKEADKKREAHRHHKHKKHKKHHKHRRTNKDSSEVDDGSTEQDVELDQIEYNMADVIEETVTIGSEEHFLMDAEHCEVMRFITLIYYSLPFGRDVTLSVSLHYREPWRLLKN